MRSQRFERECQVSRILFIVNDSLYGTERAYNALRLPINIVKKEPPTELRMFLVGDGASCAKSGQTVPQGYSNVETMLRALMRRGGTLGVCRTCMDARGLKDTELVEGSDAVLLMR